MKTPFHRPDGTQARNAFSLIEIMIAVTLMSVIILGLTAMFSQVQQAFRLGTNQNDVLEAGRVATDMIARELERITPSYNDFNNANSPTFYAAIPPYVPVIQPLPGGAKRTNIFHDLYFLTRKNQTWTGIGYYVRSNPSYNASCGPVGTLYRVEIDNTTRQFASGTRPPSSLYFTETNGVSKIVEGVVHFRVRAYDDRGFLIAPPVGASGSPYWWFNKTNNIQAEIPLARAPGEVSVYGFYSNAVPGYVEMEIGILEQQTYERYKAIPVYDAQTNFLAKHAGNVHLFRQRVPIRNVDLSAYQ